MKGLVAATVHAKYEMTYEITTSYGRGRTKEFTESYVEFHDVAIPVWVRDSCIPSDRSAITRDAPYRVASARTCRPAESYVEAPDILSKGLSDRQGAKSDLTGM